MTLARDPNQGYVFTGWTGACSGTGPCVVTMSRHKNVIATFKERQFTLATAVKPHDGGTVTGGGIHPADSVVTVAPSPQPGFFFSDWSGDCFGTGSCVVTMDTNKTITANFSKQEAIPLRFTLTASPSPPLGGVVTGGGAYRTGATVTVESTPNSGFVFTDWSGDCSGTGSCEVTLNANKSVTANFSTQRFTLTTRIDPREGGTVTPGDTYPAGSMVTVAASPNKGYGFRGWSGVCSGTGSCVVTMDANKTVTATFSKVEVEVVKEVVASPILDVSPTSLDFGTTATSKGLEIGPAGGGTLTWKISDNQPWLSVGPISGSTTTEVDNITVTVKRTGLAERTYTGIITVTYNGGTKAISVSMRVGGTTPPQFAEPPGLTGLFWNSKSKSIGKGNPSNIGLQFNEPLDAASIQASDFQVCLSPTLFKIIECITPTEASWFPEQPAWIFLTLPKSWLKSGEEVEVRLVGIIADPSGNQQKGTRTIIPAGF